MQLTQAFEDQEVRRLLGGEPGDLETAFTLVDAHLRRRFIKGAHDRLPGASPDDLADAWQETLQDLLHAVRSGGFGADRAIGPWLWTTFIRRVYDGLRCRESRACLIERARSRFDPVAVGDIQEEIDEEDRLHLLARVRAAVGTLPPRQRTVLRVFVEHYPATQDKAELLRRVMEDSGRAETPSALRRAL